MSEEPTKYNKYEVAALLRLKDSDFKMERIFDVYKQIGSDHFYYNILNTISFPDIKSPASFNTYHTKPNDTWTVISYKHYDRIDLWWIIAAFNNIDNTFKPLDTGTRLKVPTPSAIRVIIDVIKNQV